MSLLDLDRLSTAELRTLAADVLAENAELTATIAALREEIARLKGYPGRPKLKANRVARTVRSKSERRPGRRGPTVPILTIDEERVVRVAVPAGSRFKGYETFVVQDVIVRPHVIRYRRERWLTPDGQTVVAPLPAGITGHFGAGVHQLVLALYHQGQTTQPRLTTVLRDLGLLISHRQIGRLLSQRTTAFRAEAAAVARVGLATAAWVAVDDTGARHQGRNGYCTRLGDDRFTVFASRPVKSRINFLTLLGGGTGHYVINAAALDYMRAFKLPRALRQRLVAHPARHFADGAAWHAHLTALGIRARNTRRDPVTIATEGALWGAAVDQGLRPDTVIVSDDAGQFAVGRHALCWIHAERLLGQLICVSQAQAHELDRVRGEVWQLYDLLDAFRAAPSADQRAAIEAEFDRLFRQRTRFPDLTRALARLYANKAKLLRVLDYPAIPLHTNSAEHDLRAYVTRRKISAGTRSDAGRDSRDAFLSLSKTAHKNGIRFWDYLADRLNIPGAKNVPWLPDLIAQRATPH